MKTLYVSDLDGTLLTGDAGITPYTTETLNRLIAEGLQFSVATARTEYTSRYILSGLNLELPVILNNGVVLYDPVKNRYTDVKYMPFTATKRVLELSNRFDLTGFMYSTDKLTTSVYYEPSRETPDMVEFREERRVKYNKKFIPAARLEQAADGNIFYFAFLCEYERLKPIYDELQDVTEIAVAFYRETYSENLWLLEIFSELGSKYNAVMALREQFGFERVVGFGDNLNDLPLFQACDECYAVANAREELKSAASGVIGSNTDDGVARWLAANMNAT
ncbi:MAG: HAD family hydrolase [Oscillospiraceae bacterium]|nr:HAD family hydrolase [Oscillospiraceae bacterium]